jgi:hypothetical protein
MQGAAGAAVGDASPAPCACQGSLPQVPEPTGCHLLQGVLYRLQLVLSCCQQVEQQQQQTVQESCQLLAIWRGAAAVPALLSHLLLLLLLLQGQTPVQLAA